jgi:hypothetical protein
LDADGAADGEQEAKPKARGRKKKDAEAAAPQEGDAAAGEVSEADMPKKTRGRKKKDDGAAAAPRRTDLGIKLDTPWAQQIDEQVVELKEYEAQRGETRQDRRKCVRSCTPLCACTQPCTMHMLGLIV